MTELTLRSTLKRLEALIQEDALEEASALCRHTLSHFPKNGAAYRYLSRVLILQSKWDEASEVLRRLLGAYPDDFEAHYQLSLVYERLKRPDASLWHIERAFDQQPNNKTVINRLRKLYATQRNIDIEKIQLTSSAIAQQYLRSDLPEQAVDVLRKDPMSLNGRPDMLLQLAQALWAAGRRVDAAETALNLLKLTPYAVEANRIMTSFWLEEDRPSDAQRYLSRIEDVDPYLAIEIATAGPPAADLVMMPAMDYDRFSQREASETRPDWLEDLTDDNIESDSDWLKDIEDAPQQAAPQKRKATDDLEQLLPDRGPVLGDDDIISSDLDLEGSLPPEILAQIKNMKQRAAEDTVVSSAPNAASDDSEDLEALLADLDQGSASTGLTGLLGGDDAFDDLLLDDLLDDSDSPPSSGGRISTGLTGLLGDDDPLDDDALDDLLGDSMPAAASGGRISTGLTGLLGSLEPEEDEEEDMDWLADMASDDSSYDSSGEANEPAADVSWLEDELPPMSVYEDNDESQDENWMSDVKPEREQPMSPLAGRVSTGLTDFLTSLEAEGEEGEFDSEFDVDEMPADDQVDPLAWLQDSGIDLVDDAPGRPRQIHIDYDADAPVNVDIEDADPLAWLQGSEIELSDEQPSDFFEGMDTGMIRQAALDDEALSGDDPLAWLQDSGVELSDDEPAQRSPAQDQPRSSTDWLADDEALQELMAMEALSGDFEDEPQEATASNADWLNDDEAAYDELSFEDDELSFEDEDLAEEAGFELDFDASALAEAEAADESDVDWLTEESDETLEDALLEDSLLEDALQENAQFGEEFLFEDAMPEDGPYEAELSTLPTDWRPDMNPDYENDRLPDPDSENDMDSEDWLNELPEDADEFDEEFVSEDELDAFVTNEDVPQASKAVDFGFSDDLNKASYLEQPLLEEDEFDWDAQLEADLEADDAAYFDESEGEAVLNDADWMAELDVLNPLDELQESADAEAEPEGFDEENDFADLLDEEPAIPAQAGWMNELDLPDNELEQDAEAEGEFADEFSYEFEDELTSDEFIEDEASADFSDFEDPAFAGDTIIEAAPNWLSEINDANADDGDEDEDLLGEEWEEEDEAYEEYEAVAAEADWLNEMNLGPEDDEEDEAFAEDALAAEEEIDWLGSVAPGLEEEEDFSEELASPAASITDALLGWNDNNIEAEAEAPWEGDDLWGDDAEEEDLAPASAGMTGMLRSIQSSRLDDEAEDESFDLDEPAADWLEDFETVDTPQDQPDWLSEVSFGDEESEEEPEVYAEPDGDEPEEFEFDYLPQVEADASDSDEPLDDAFFDEDEYGDEAFAEDDFADDEAFAGDFEGAFEQQAFDEEAIDEDTPEVTPDILAVSDWMDEGGALAEPDTLSPVEAEADWLEAYDEMDEEAEPEAEAISETPDWLEAYDEIDEEAEPEAEAISETPDWLDEYEDEEAEPEAEAISETPEWLDEYDEFSAEVDDEAVAETEPTWLGEYDSDIDEEAEQLNAQRSLDAEWLDEYDDGFESPETVDEPQWSGGFQRSELADVMALDEDVYDEELSLEDRLPFDHDAPLEDQDLYEADAVQAAETSYYEDDDVDAVPAYNAPDWLNAMVPGLDVNFDDISSDEDEEAEETAPVDTAPHRRRMQSVDEQEESSFEWLSQMVEDEEVATEAARPIRRYVFSRMPGWMRNLLGANAGKNRPAPDLDPDADED